MANGNEIAYPPELEDAELKLINIRRKAIASDIFSSDQLPASEANLVGVALSGGGVRSATFSLGIFQGLANLNLLNKIDYLSTVSGGGYFGSFYGRLFTRDQVESTDDVENILRTEKPSTPNPTPNKINKKEKLKSETIIDWLRENGRYLTPKGSGDYLMSLTVLLRNWFAIQTFSLIFILTILLAITLAVVLVECICPEIGKFTSQYFGYRFGSEGWPLWGSPLFAIPAMLFIGLLLPLNWAYWVAALRWRGPQPEGRDWLWFVKHPHPIMGPGSIAVFAVASYIWVSRTLAWMLVAVAALGIFALVLWASAEARGRVRIKDASGDLEDPLTLERMVPKLLSDWMSVGLKWTLWFFVVGVVDTFGQTIYTLSTFGTVTLTQWITGLLAAVTLAVARGQTLIGGLSSGNAKAKWKIPLFTMAACAGAILFMLMLVLVDAAAHAIIWQLSPPSNIPIEIRDYVGTLRCKALQSSCPGTAAALLPTATLAKTWLTLTPALLTLGVLVVLSWLLGTQWDFLNWSTLQPLYGARLARAYLGASNQYRHTGSGASVTDPIPGDDITEQEYWSDRTGPWIKGGPLHLVNVTINETILGRSQIEQQDRRGVGMAKGPCALSVGVRHHRLSDGVIKPNPGGYRVFEETGRPTENFALSQWIGISGAAFSTGMGFQTSLGLSLLTGILNVRLGYWWDSGVLRGRESSLFSVQRFLLTNEWLARFPGTARQHWYLSDGGHFENTGAYELVRRRLPLMIVVDAGADPTQQFDDVANLVRKARIDFGAEIEFLDSSQLYQLKALQQNRRCYFGALNELKYGADIQAWGEGVNAIARVPCAALAKVRYVDDSSRQSWLILLKPTIVGEDPIDLANYRQLNPTFPNETTADQFFDEAQWESYRKLGEVIATRVFAHAASSTESVDPFLLLR